MDMEVYFRKQKKTKKISKAMKGKIWKKTIGEINLIFPYISALIIENFCYFMLSLGIITHIDLYMRLVLHMLVNMILSFTTGRHLSAVLINRRDGGVIVKHNGDDIKCNSHLTRGNRWRHDSPPR